MSVKPSLGLISLNLGVLSSQALGLILPRGGEEKMIDNYASLGFQAREDHIQIPAWLLQLGGPSPCLNRSDLQSL